MKVQKQKFTVTKKFSVIPYHVGIIMDGNGRWAKARGLPRIQGHREGAKSVDSVVQVARKIGIKYLTLYAFSKDNWNRPISEVRALMELLQEYLVKERERMRKNGIRFNVIGNIDDLPPEVIDEIEAVKKYTEGCSDMVLTLALSYSGRREIVKVLKKAVELCVKGKLKPSDIDENFITSELGLPDVDLLIRTSGEMRISDFLLWHIPYAEIYITKKLWPDFRGRDFLKAINWFQGRERRFGMTSEQIRKLSNIRK